MGVTREANLLRVKPCILTEWKGFELFLQFGGTRYEIEIMRGDGPAYTSQDDVEIVSANEYLITLRDLGGIRKITLPIAG